MKYEKTDREGRIEKKREEKIEGKKKNRNDKRKTKI